MEAAQLIALVSSIAACASAAATFATVRQIAKQRTSSYRPELVFATGHIVAQKRSSGTGFPDVWSRRSKGARPMDGSDVEGVQSPSMHVDLHNLGLGAAKDISIEWSIPAAAMVETANDLSQRSLSQAFFELKGDVLSLNSKDYGKYYSMLGNQKNSRHDYALPASTGSDPLIVSIPIGYVQLVSAIIYLFFQNEEKTFPDIPTASIKVSYKDMADANFSKNFIMKFDLAIVKEKGASFEAIASFSQ